MLIDDVIASHQLPLEWPPGSTLEDILRHFRKALVVRNQNVWDYYKLNMMGKENPNKDFPNVAPPAPNMWFEWVTEDAGIIDSKNEETSKCRLKMGVLCFAADLSELDAEGLEVASREAQARGFHIHARARWFGFGFIFTRILDSDKFPHLIGRIDWQVGHDGELLPSAGDEGFAYAVRSVYAAAGVGEKIATTILCAAQVCWLALSFMHCKNVRIEKGPPISDKLRRARERKNKPALFRYHTLVINPSQPVPAAHGASGGSCEGGQALHICRGHFKDFSARGLFGKHRGTYWWPMYARGSITHGTVSKDYEVRP